MKKGFDLSYSQPHVDWANLSKQALDFCYVKVCEGLHTIDSMCSNHAQGAADAHLSLGYYYFAHPGRCDAKASAQYFKANLQALPLPDLIHALDIEINEQNISPAEMLQWIHDFITEWNGPIMIYGGPGFLNANLPANHYLGNVPLWVAEYPTNPGEEPTQIPRGWDTYAIWQYTGNGSIPGIANPVDLNVSPALPFISPNT